MSSQINWYVILTKILSVRMKDNQWCPTIAGYPVPGTESMRLDYDGAWKFGYAVASFMQAILDTVTEHLEQTAASRLLGTDTVGLFDAVQKDQWDAVNLAAIADMIEEKRGETVEAQRIRSMIVQDRSILVVEMPEGVPSEVSHEALRRLTDRVGCEIMILPHGWRASMFHPKETNP